MIKAEWTTLYSATAVIPLLLYFTLQCLLVVRTSYCALYTAAINIPQCESRMNQTSKFLKQLSDLLHK